MDFVYVNRQGDLETVNNYKKELKKLPLSKLIEKYNREARMGIVGVHQQGLFIIALHFEFIRRIENSPIKFEGNLGGLRGVIKEIKSVDNTIVYTDE